MRPLRWAFSAVTTLAVLYLAFFVPLGERTVWEHARRIAGTDEAQEFSRDVQTAGRRVLTKAHGELRDGLRLGRDAGASDATSAGAGFDRLRRARR